MYAGVVRNAVFDVVALADSEAAAVQRRPLTDRALDIARQTASQAGHFEQEPLPLNRMTKGVPNYFFLDADNFMYKGTFDLARMIYGELYWRAKKRIPLDDERQHPKPDDLKAGFDFFYRTTNMPEANHFPILLNEVGLPHADPLPYLEFFKRRLRREIGSHVQLVPGAARFLKWLEERRAKGYDVRIYMLSSSSDLAVERSAKALGIQRYFNRLIAPPLVVGQPFSKSQKIIETVGTGPRGFVAMGGDSPKDVLAAQEATAAGVPTLSFATPTGLDSEADLRNAGADVIVPNLLHTVTLEHAFMKGVAAPGLKEDFNDRTRFSIGMAALIKRMGQSVVHWDETFVETGRIILDPFVHEHVLEAHRLMLEARRLHPLNQQHGSEFHFYLPWEWYRIIRIVIYPEDRNRPIPVVHKPDTRSSVTRSG